MLILFMLSTILKDSTGALSMQLSAGLSLLFKIMEKIINGHI